MSKLGRYSVYLDAEDQPKRLDISIIIGIMMKHRIEKILLRMRENPKNVRFADLCKICDRHFGTPRQQGTSHRVYKTPWEGDPRINIQNHKGTAKAYQVKQVLQAIEKMENKDEPERRSLYI